MPHTELEHTADILIRVWGQTLDELFSDAATAMAAVMFEHRRCAGVEKTFSLTADDPESLLHDFLSELLFLSEVESIVFSDIRARVEGNTVHCTARGEPFSPERHRGGTEIKGISYSGLRIINTDKGYQVDILFDV
ncbi:MAG: archease [Methanomicrobiaceae archaeon]|nr:archease [Methanomicrobiaceae archaeon]